MHSITQGSARINGDASFEIIGGNITYQKFDLKLRDREAVTIYCFNSLMFPYGAKRAGKESYLFKGPKLGFYYDTQDLREGPCVNHYFEFLEIFIEYIEGGANIAVKGEADLSRSNVDTYWYKGATQGKWKFEAEFTHTFSDVSSS